MTPDPRALPLGWALRPLKWTREPPVAMDRKPGTWWAEGVGGHYEVDESGRLWFAHDPFQHKECGNLQAAKDAAWADHQARAARLLVRE